MKSSPTIVAQSHLVLFQAVGCIVFGTLLTSSCILLSTLALLVMCLFLISSWEFIAFLWKLKRFYTLFHLPPVPSTVLHSQRILLSLKLEVLAGEHRNSRTLGQGMVPSHYDGHLDRGHSFGRKERGAALKEQGQGFSWVDQRNQRALGGCPTYPSSLSFELIDFLTKDCWP